MTRSIAVIAAVALASFAVGCSSADDNGTAPSLTGITFDKTELAVGVQSDLVVTVSFADPDADIQTIHVQLEQDGTVKQAPQALPLNEASGKTEGQQQLVLRLGSPIAGTIKSDFWLVDAKGNESAHQTQDIVVK